MVSATKNILRPSSLWTKFTDFPRGFFQRRDEAPDTQFYSEARLVEHIDEYAIARLRVYYGEALQAALKSAKQAEDQRDKVRILDLCSSWISHLPENLDTSTFEVVGVGMNADELRENPVLSNFHVVDLNAAVGPAASDQAITPGSLKMLEDNSFDIVLNSVSVDYLTKPFAVFQETLRVLKPGGLSINTFSNRCFPTKAIRPWLESDDEEHCRIVGSYFKVVSEGEDFRKGRHKRNPESFDEIAAFDISPRPGRSDPLYVVQARKKVGAEDVVEDL